MIEGMNDRRNEWEEEGSLVFSRLVGISLGRSQDEFRGMKEGMMEELEEKNLRLKPFFWTKSTFSIPFAEDLASTANLANPPWRTVTQALYRIVTSVRCSGKENIPSFSHSFPHSFFP
jgi:hypothetical protein